MMAQETPAYLLTREQMEQRLSRNFSPEQTDSLVYVFNNIREIEIQRAADTSELKQGLSNLTKEVHHLSEQMGVLSDRVTTLSDAQIETDKSLKALAEAQQRTDERFAELADAQRSTQVQLAESARRTDERFAEMTISLQQLDNTIDALALSQQRTMETMDAGFAMMREANEVTNWRIDHLAQQVGSLANTFGFNLEEFTGALLPSYLARYFAIMDLELARSL